MKLLVHISLIIAYILPSIGITISKHYCGGEVSSISFLCIADDNCGCGNKKMKADCCKDEITQFKIQDSQFQTDNSHITFQKTGLKRIFVNDFVSKLNDVNESSNSFFSRRHPPDIVVCPIFIINQAFLI